MSHGESFLALLRSRFDSPGLYCLDEPEAGLSFSAQVSLAATLHDVAALGGQVVCATHSPLVAALPGARLLEVGSHVPPPEVARTYLVFFDFNRADLTARAREIIGEAAQNSRRVGATRIEVAGHADRSGTPQYNQRLSQRRAEAVASELVARGVNRSDIGVTAFGESRPLVQTADGVREPQNRRVEIVLR